MLVTVLGGVAVAVTGKPDDSGDASSPRCRDTSLCLLPPAGLLLLSSVLSSPRLSLRPASLSLSFFFLFPFFFLLCSPLFFFFSFLSLSHSVSLSISPPVFFLVSTVSVPSLHSFCFSKKNCCFPPFGLSFLSKKKLSDSLSLSISLLFLFQNKILPALLFSPPPLSLCTPSVFIGRRREGHPALSSHGAGHGEMHGGGYYTAAPASAGHGFFGVRAWWCQ